MMRLKRENFLTVMVRLTINSHPTEVYCDSQMLLSSQNHLYSIENNVIIQDLQLEYENE